MTQLNRRQFATLATAGVLLPGGVAQAEAPLTHLTAGSRILEVKGKAAKVYGITDKNGRPGLNMLSNGQFAVRLSNGLDIETLVHWHGLTPPLQFDGTPHLSGPVLAPGETRDYVFKSRDTGTHWMHSHVGLQEQQMLAAPLIIRETDSPLEDEQEHVVLLHDFTFRDPQDILAELQKGGGGHAAHMGQPMGGGHDMKNMDTMKMDTMGAGMAMMNDIVFDALLANDRTLDDPEVVPAEKGGRFRLRLINGAAASNMWVDLGGIEGTLIAVDGRVVAPVRGSRFPLAIAQRADIRLTLPAGSGAWPILFQAEGSDLQAGIVLRAGDGAVAKLSDRGTSQPALDLSLERHLRTQIVRPEIAVSRQEFVMLTGGGADYVWGLNGRPMMHDILFKVREGERYQVTFHNMTGMAHPMHFHGHYFKVVGIGMAAIDGALRDTVLVPPDEMVTVEFDAGNPGTWALHCHHLYHMNSGMMGAVAYESAA